MAPPVAASRAAIGPPRGAITIGDSSVLAARILGVAHAPERVAYILARTAYVTILSLDDKTIVPLRPVAGRRSELTGDGPQMAGLTGESRANGSSAVGSGQRPGATDDLTSAAAVQEYNRCVANARQANKNRRSGPRPIVGRDSAGQPTYGPPAETADDARRSIQDEDRCAMPTIGLQQAIAASVPAKPGRFLVLFASDTPIEHRDVTDLVVTSADIAVTVRLIGEKLFGVRGALWSASYLPW